MVRRGVESLPGNGNQARTQERKENQRRGPAKNSSRRLLHRKRTQEAHWHGHRGAGEGRWSRERARRRLEAPFGTDRSIDRSIRKVTVQASKKDCRNFVQSRGLAKMTDNEGWTEGSSEPPPLNEHENRRPPRATRTNERTFAMTYLNLLTSAGLESWRRGG
jgi:hypothetical protein